MGRQTDKHEQAVKVEETMGSCETHSGSVQEDAAEGGGRNHVLHTADSHNRGELNADIETLLCSLMTQKRLEQDTSLNTRGRVSHVEAN